MHIKKTKPFIALLLLLPACCFAQKKLAFKATDLSQRSANLVKGLEQNFSEFKILDFEPAQLTAFLENKKAIDLELKIDVVGEFAFTLQAVQLRSADYVIWAEGAAKKIIRPSKAQFYSGKSKEGHKLRLSVFEDRVEMMLSTDKELYFLEKAQTFSEFVSSSSYVWYAASKVQAPVHQQCMLSQVEAKRAELPSSNRGNAASYGCVKVQLAIASDYSMYQAYGSDITALENRNLAIINNVNMDFDDDFERIVEFAVVEQFVSTAANTAAETAWTSTSDVEILLETFSDWGKTGFSSKFDLGQFWTKRDIAFQGNMNIVGFAWTPGVCNVDYRFQILEDYSSVASLIRATVSHETGHNFSASHDGVNSGNIMATNSPQGSSLWSAQSIAEINNHLFSQNCVYGNMALGGTPVADFTIHTTDCMLEEIELIDQSGRNPSEWMWSTPSANPIMDTQQNTMISYANGGSYTINLAAMNEVCNGMTMDNQMQAITILNYTAPMGTCPLLTSNANTTVPFNTGIYGVSLKNIQHSSGSAFSDGMIYDDRSCTEVANLEADSSYVLSVTVGTMNPERVQVFIDYNNDGDFSDSGESIFSWASATGARSGTFTVPSDAPIGVLFRMRIISDLLTPSACTTPTYGQAVDFGLVVGQASSSGCSCFGIQSVQKL